MPKTTIGLALGGGGARGAAHIGVLRVIEKHQIPIHRIAGTSAGAIIGAMYAATQDPHWIEARFREFLASDVFDHLGTKSLLGDRDPDSVFGQIAKFVQDQFVIVMAANRVSIIKRARLERAIDFLLPVKRFKGLQIPMEVFVTDLQSGDCVRYRTGDLVEAVVQSSSIPGYVPPTEINGRMLIDGGVSNPVPVKELKETTDFVIAIDISRGKPPPIRKANMFEIMTRAERITSFHLTSLIASQADFVIKPDVQGLHWSQFEEFDTLLQNGIIAAEDNIDLLKSVIRRKQSWLFRVKQWFDGKN